MRTSEDVAEVGVLVIRPSAAQYKRWLRTMPAVGLLVAGMLVMGRPDSDTAGLATAALVASPIFACLAGALVVYFRRAHVVVTPTHIGKARFRQQPRLRPREDIASAVIATLRPAGDPESRAFENLFLFDNDDRRLLRLTSQYWTREDIRRVTATLGITPVVLDGVLTGRDLADSHPHALRWPERHPVPFAVLIVVSMIGMAFSLAGLVGAFLPT